MASTHPQRNNCGSHDSRVQFYCGFCKKDNHLESRYYKKHGYPPGHPRYATQSAPGSTPLQNTSSMAPSPGHKKPTALAIFFKSNLFEKFIYT